MKTLIVLILGFLAGKSYGQFDKCVSLVPSVAFNFNTKGLTTNDAGLGFNLDASVFSKHKLQLLLETSIDRFFGDKLFILDAKGRENKPATIYAIKAGPQLFVSKHIALSTTFGPAWHSIRAVGFTNDYGFKLGITGFPDNRRRLVTKLFMVDILKQNLNIQYFGLQLGYRFS